MCSLLLALLLLSVSWSFVLWVCFIIYRCNVHKKLADLQKKKSKMLAKQQICDFKLHIQHGLAFAFSSMFYCQAVFKCKKQSGCKSCIQRKKAENASSHIGGETCEAMQRAHTLKSCQIYTNLRNELTLYVFHNWSHTFSETQLLLCLQQPRNGIFASIISP